MSEQDTFEAIAHPVRRAILDRLRMGEANVRELAEPFDATRPAISQHLKVLRDSGLVTSRKQGRLHIYRLEAENLASIYAWVSQFETFWTERLDALGAFLDAEEGDGDAT